ncbi:MAG: restriction endonuclease subunit S [Phycisphaerae bacterium]|nr:restriction endonuclease subunit S [Phycisphaerae bacterium]
MSRLSSSAEWTTSVTGDLIAAGKLSIGDGYRAKNSELSSDGLPFARAGNIDGGFHFGDADRFPEADLAKVGDKISRPGDVVFTSKGTVGRMAWVREATPRFVYAPQLCFWRSLDLEVIDPRWLYYWMHGEEFRPQMLGVKGQTDMADYVSLTDQRRMEISLPPIDLQRAIAAVLGSLDDKIEQNRRTARVLERLARAVFRAWFVDFEPVKAKAAGATSFPSMPQPIFDALPTTFTHSELGPIPAGWQRTRRVADLEKEGVLLIGDGYRAKRAELAEAGLPFVRAGNVHETVNTDGAELLGAEAVSRAGVKRSQIWDTVFTSKGTVGRIGLVTSGTGDVVYAPQVCFWRAVDPGRLCPFFLHLWMRSGLFTRQWMAVKGQTDMADFVSLSDQRAMMLLLPPPPVQRAFADVVQPMIELQAQLGDESRELAALRDYLLPKLLSGQVRVGETENVS